MIRQLDAVAFDLDGTLVDTMAVAPSVYTRSIRALGGPDLTADDITEIWRIGPTATVLGQFLRRPITPADLELLHDTFEDATRSIESFDGIAAMLHALRGRGYRLGVYTTATRRAATTMLAAAGLADLVGAVVGGDEVMDPKPAADGLLRLAHHLGTAPERIAYVGDTSIDVQCADAAGSVGILATWGAPDAIPGSGTTTAGQSGDVIDLVLSLASSGPSTHRETSRAEPRPTGAPVVEGVSDRWPPGHVVVHQEVWADRVWAARPTIVAADEPTRLVLWLPHGTRRKVPAAPPRFQAQPRHNDGGLPTEADHRGVIENLASGAWTHTDHHWDVSTLCILRPGEWHAVWVSWLASGEHLGWYVNLQRPYRRTRLGIEAMDLMLDIVVEPDLSWRWKDREEFDEIARRGIFDPDLVGRVRHEGRSVIERIEARAAPFSEAWPGWQPDPDWSIPVLPAGWDVPPE